MTGMGSGSSSDAQIAATGRSDKQIWPCGRYEVYGGDKAMLDMERLNGFHTEADALECAQSFVDVFENVIVLDRADRFVWDGDGPIQVSPKLMVTRDKGCTIHGDLARARTDSDA